MNSEILLKFAYFIVEPERIEKNDQIRRFRLFPVMTPKLVEEKSTGFDMLSKLKQESLFRKSTTDNKPSLFNGDNEEEVFD